MGFIFVLGLSLPVIYTEIYIAELLVPSADVLESVNFIKESNSISLQENIDLTSFTNVNIPQPVKVTKFDQFLENKAFWIGLMFVEYTAALMLVQGGQYTGNVQVDETVLNIIIDLIKSLF